MLGTLSYERTDEKINYEETKYWKRMVKSNLKIGVEIETNLASSISNSDARDRLRRALVPTGSYGTFGKSGVIEVKGDGSLENGIELVTTGRRLDFLDYYSQYKSICAHIFRYQPILNQRCGLHNHMLMDYGSSYNSLEKNMPGTILKNFVQLLKRHMPEIVWLTSTVKDSRAVTRMENFCNADTLLKFTPLNRTIEEFVDKVSVDGGGGSNRYKFINFKAMAQHVDNNEIKRFHFELRFPDGSLYSSQIASQNMLYASMMLKAIELSEGGVINCGNSELWEETKVLYKSIRQYQDSYNSGRLSTPPTQEQTERIKERCKDMLLELKPNLDSFDNHIYGILSIFAETPISIMRRTQTDTEINENMHNIIKNMYSFNAEEFKNIIEIINLNKIVGTNSETDYKIKLANILDISLVELNSKLFKLNLYKTTKYDNLLKSYVFV